MKTVRTFAAILVSILFCSASYSATISVQDYDPESKNPSFSSRWMAIGQAGDSAKKNGNQKKYELIMSDADSTKYATGEAASYEWPSGKAVPFSLTYDSKTGWFLFTVDSTTVRTQSQEILNYNALLITARADSSTQSSLSLNNLMLDHYALNHPLSAFSSTQAMLITSDLMSDGFTLTGEVTMNINSRSANNGKLAFDIEVGNASVPVPEASTVFLLAVGSMPFFRRRRT